MEPGVRWQAEQEAAAQQGHGRAPLFNLVLAFVCSPVCPEEQGAGLRACRKRFSGLSSVVILRAGIEHPLT